ncbi:Hypothetical predicted protein [Olea europaea subsp. europaea]|uniref:Uncharacterized protein n=1 Tax=Olea europaea subsp. europaea TaxID=158383 RepID=A0A8S0TS92_OLEEU|nr:Hypothetical predicted protein [Olea europaea subsp. europaea]
MISATAHFSPASVSSKSAQSLYNIIGQKAAPTCLIPATNFGSRQFEFSNLICFGGAEKLHLYRQHGPKSSLTALSPPVAVVLDSSQQLQVLYIYVCISLAAGETIKDSEADKAPSVKREKSGPEPMIVPIIIKMADFDHKGLTVVNISATTFPQTLDWLNNYLLHWADGGKLDCVLIID